MSAAALTGRLRETRYVPPVGHLPGNAQVSAAERLAWKVSGGKAWVHPTALSWASITKAGNADARTVGTTLFNLAAEIRRLRRQRASLRARITRLETLRRSAKVTTDVQVVALRVDLADARHNAAQWEDLAKALQRRLDLVTGIQDLEPF